MPWYRTILPNQELQILAIRDRLTNEDLDKQAIIPPQGYGDATNPFPGNFTTLSCFQYLASGTKQYIFDKSSIGVLIVPQQEPRKVIWRNSLRTEVSDHIFKQYSNVEAFKKKLSENQFEFITEDKISKKVQECFNDLKQDYKKDGFDPADAELPWTEGLFRYKIKEINGIVVNLGNPTSCKVAYAFNTALRIITKTESDLPYFELQQESNYPSTLDSKKVEQIARQNFNIEEIRALCKSYLAIYQSFNPIH